MEPLNVIIHIIILSIKFKCLLLLLLTYDETTFSSHASRSSSSSSWKAKAVTTPENPFLLLLRRRAELQAVSQTLHGHRELARMCTGNNNKAEEFTTWR